jgi:hypothetical protein
MVVHVYNFSYSEGKGQKFQASWDKVSETLSQKQNTNERVGDVAQVVPIMCRGHEIKPQYNQKKHLTSIMKPYPSRI